MNQSLVNAVKQHAKRNYQRGGWDYVTECWSDDNIATVIKYCRTARGAIDRVRQYVKEQHDLRG